MKTIVYVDGFNLYYGALRGTPYKWLDVVALCRALLPRHEVTGVKYFTARVSPRESDPQQRTRQQVYLRAIQARSPVEISATSSPPGSGCPSRMAASAAPASFG